MFRIYMIVFGEVINILYFISMYFPLYLFILHLATLYMKVLSSVPL